MKAPPHSEEMISHTTANVAIISSREITEMEEKVDFIIRGRINTIPDIRLITLNKSMEMKLLLTRMQSFSLPTKYVAFVSFYVYKL